MPKQYFSTWGLEWYSKNKQEGVITHLIFDNNCLPAMFPSRRLARLYAQVNYGCIKRRKDLRTEPHGWRFPRPVRILGVEYAR